MANVRSAGTIHPGTITKLSCTVRTGEGKPAAGTGTISPDRRLSSLIGADLMSNPVKTTHRHPSVDGSWPLHPFLLAPASVLALLANSLNQATFADAAPALAGTLAFACAVYLAVGALRRRLDARTAVIAGIWIGGCLFYAGLFGVLNDLVGGGYPMVRSLPPALAALALLTVLAIRLPAAPVKAVNLVLNAIAVVIVATPLWQAAAHEWRNGAARAIYDADRAAAAMPQIAATGGMEGAERPPDIYHFVFDRYASQEVLAAHYDVDDSATARFLEARGFHVARASHANYHRTAHSLASTFYMDYLDLFAGAPGLAGDNWQPVHAMLGDHRAARFLRARGYDFFQFGSWWTGTFHNRVADVNRPHGFGEFTMLYLRRTILRPIFHALPDRPLTMRLAGTTASASVSRPRSRRSRRSASATGRPMSSPTSSCRTGPTTSRPTGAA